MSVSDTCLTWERLGHGCLRVCGVSSRKIILFYSGHGSDTFQTRLQHSNVKIERKKKKKELCKLVAPEPRRLSDLPSYLSCVVACSLLIACIYLFLFSADLSAASRRSQIFFLIHCFFNLLHLQKFFQKLSSTFRRVLYLTR